jgi:hypothetical protein
MEILEDKNQAVPIRNEHLHLFLPEAEIARARAWYAKTFGAAKLARFKVVTEEVAPQNDASADRVRSLSFA